MRVRFLFLLLTITSLKIFGQTQIQPETLKKMQDSSKTVQLIDVRTPEEFRAGYIAGAININAYETDFVQQLERLDRNRPLVVYCKVGGRSAKAASELAKLGFENVYDLSGGMLSWENRGLPLENGSRSADKFLRVDFDKLLADNAKVLVDFYAPWCGPCKEMEPDLERVAAQNKDQILVYRLNIDEARMLAKELGIEAIPILTIYHRGRAVKSVTGLQSHNQLKRLAKKLVRLK